MGNRSRTHILEARLRVCVNNVKFLAAGNEDTRGKKVGALTDLKDTIDTEIEKLLGEQTVVTDHFEPEKT